MVLFRCVEPQKVFVVRLPFASDLIEELTRFCCNHGIRLGHVSGLGAVRRATIAYYNQTSRQYEKTPFDEPMEILSLTGNISIRDGQPFVHAHIVLAQRDGRAVGGHLCEGTEVFAAECVIEAFTGEDLLRAPDSETGLQLWQPSPPAPS